jgi:hypothetical protein
MRVCVIFCSTIPALKFTFFKEELFGLCPENSGTPRQLRFSYSTENSEEPFFELNSFPAQPFTHFPLAANFAIPQTLLKSPWLGNRPRHDEPACSQSSPAPDGSPLGTRPQEFFVLTTVNTDLQSHWQLHPPRRGEKHLAQPSVAGPNGFFICVGLCSSVVKMLSCCAPSKTPQFRSQKSAKTPAKTPIVNPRKP